ncbi:MAG: hypothetical protein PHG14_09705 [Desulfobacter postgatei]|uniref:hypothetical protein n=1 Tax=Desulfobacter postgatei TaxID=2293 RepID=UPI0023F43B3A|nr:hypothetical protein [Desulfobacter postgatei]MDD4273988.1 hypothetical protein [Desulfobacter postgatei]
MIPASLWIVWKSPLLFMPVLDLSGAAESNPAEVYYYYIEFIAWVLISIPGIMFIFSSLDFRSFIARHRLLLLTFINFFYALFRTFKTFDMTDTGFHFTKAWGLLHGSVSQNVDFLVGTSFINGLWLSVFGEPNVLWARLGYVFLVTGIAVVSFKIYSIYFTRLSLWLIFIILSLFFIHYNYYLSINYDNLPVLFGLVGIWLLLKKKTSWLSYILSGIFLFSTVWLKFNFILILVLPVIFAWVLYEEKQKWLGPAGFLCLGYGICLVAGIIMLYGSGNLETYVNYLEKNLVHTGDTGSDHDQDSIEIARQEGSSESVESSFSSDSLFFLDESQRSTPERQSPLYSMGGGDSHVLKQLFRSYFWGAWNILQKGAALSVLLFILLLLLGDTSSKKRYILLGLCAFSIHYATYLFIEGPFFIYVTVSILPAYFFLLFYLRYARDLILPTVLIILLAVLSFPGSNLSFNVIYRSGSGLLFLAFPLAFMLDKEIRINRQVLKMNNYVIIFVMSISFGILHPWGYNNSHRDLGDRSILFNMFKSPQLFGIHTFSQRAKVIDETLEFFNHETYERDNTPALFLGWVPMMYYLTQTNCLMNNPWHGCISFKAFKPEFDKTTESRPPVYITFSKIMTRNPRWPLKDEEYRKQDNVWISDLKKFDYVRYWMKDKNYSKVFENDMFEVYKYSHEEAVRTQQEILNKGDE